MNIDTVIKVLLIAMTLWTVQSVCTAVEKTNLVHLSEITLKKVANEERIEAPDFKRSDIETEFECGDVAFGETFDLAGRLFYLALAHEYGDHGVKQDYTKAMRLYRKAAEAGSAAAMSNIGCMYQHGRGVVTNSARAVYWFTKAANAGDPLGIHQLALANAFGIGAERDLSVAKCLLILNSKYGPSSEWLRAFVKDQDITSGLALAAEERDDRDSALWCAERYGNEYSAEFSLLGSARYYGAYFYGNEYLVATHSLLQRDKSGPSDATLRKLLETGFATNVSALVELSRAYANPSNKMQDLAFSDMLYSRLLEELDLRYESLRKELEKEHSALKKEMIDVVYIRNRAMNGSIDDMVELGRRYLEGRGVSYNYSESIAWFKAAIEAQRRAAHRVQEEGFWSKVSLFAKNNWRVFSGAIIGGALGWAMFWLFGLCAKKIRDWWILRRIKIGVRINTDLRDESKIDPEDYIVDTEEECDPPNPTP